MIRGGGLGGVRVEMAHGPREGAEEEPGRRLAACLRRHERRISRLFAPSRGLVAQRGQTGPGAKLPPVR